MNEKGGYRVATPTYSEFLLGNEVAALAAIHAGISAAYAYPGTPATEVVEYVHHYTRAHGRPHCAWSANEKTAYEEALGVTLVGKRALVAMKHVGLNVAADPFINSALVAIHAGLVVLVADDPSMHSSQNEQDSRYYADFARVPCFEPATHQETYDMTREAFAASERLEVPVMVRLVTRLAHTRERVVTRPPLPERAFAKAPRPSSWILMPMNARRQWHELIGRQAQIEGYAEDSPYNARCDRSSDANDLVITTGIAGQYFLEVVPDLPAPLRHLQIGVYPFPKRKVRDAARGARRIWVIEEGYPYLERYLRGLLDGFPTQPTIAGKLTGELPLEGELCPEHVRGAFGLTPRPSFLQGAVAEDGATSLAVSLPPSLPARPPQLCAGCPHIDSFDALREALRDYDPTLVTSDIGCYTLGALPPYSIIETCVCMGASVSLAKGAADVGFRPVLAVIGDSTFLHSGMTPLLDAVASRANMTLIILDNQTVGMTGGQSTIIASSKLKDIVLGLGVEPEHVHVVDVHRRYDAANAKVIRDEIESPGVSVIIAVRECIQTVRYEKDEIGCRS